MIENIKIKRNKCQLFQTTPTPATQPASLPNCIIQDKTMFISSFFFFSFFLFFLFFRFFIIIIIFFFNRNRLQLRDI
jgi:hypothetical protein